MTAEEKGGLGKASLELTAETTPFKKNVASAERSGRGLEDALHGIVDAGKWAETQLGRVKMSPGQASESRASASEILAGVRGISDESRAAADDLDRVRITERQAAESAAAGEEIKHNVADIGDEADRTKRKLTEMKIAGGGHNAVGGTTIPILAGAIGAAALTLPAAGPGLLGLLAAIPALALTGAGALGTLYLAFKGVGDAIGGNQKAFEKLQPQQKQFVLDIRSLSGEFHKLQSIAGRNLFPGLDKALHETLTPGTLHLISAALAEFGKAIGQAGQMWGRWFGSPEFQRLMGPLLREGARGLDVASRTALHLADALIVLGHSAIPFLNWLGVVTVKGSKWIDALVHARDATGQLGGAMREAEVSLTLVGHLVESLGRVVYSLGAALYPVSKVAVKDLSDGLNWLSHVIDDNRRTIQAIVGGALAALKAVLVVLVPIVGGLAHALVSVVNSMGGWEPAFAMVISGFLIVRFASLALGVIGFGKAIVEAGVKAATQLGFVAVAEEGVGTAAVTAATEAEGAFALIGAAAAGAAAGGVALLVGGLALAYYWMTQVNQVMGSLPTAAQDKQSAALAKKLHKQYYGAYEAYYYENTQNQDPNNPNSKLVPIPGHHVMTFSQWLEKHHPAALTKANGGVDGGGPGGSGSGAAGKGKLLALAREALGKPYLWGGSGPGGFDCSGLVMWAFANGLDIHLPHSTYQQVKMGQQVDPRFAQVGDVVFTNYGEGGKAGPGHEGLIVGFTKSGQPIIESAPHKGTNVQKTVGYDSFTGGGKYTVRDLTAATYSGGPSPWGKPPAWTKTSTSTSTPTGSNLLPVTLLDAIQHAKDMAAKTQGKTALHWLDVEQADLAKAKSDLERKLSSAKGKQRAAIEAEIRNIDGQLTSVNVQIAANLKAQAAAVQQAYRQHLQTVRAGIAAAMSALKQQLDQQFQQNTQAYIDTVLGSEFFQGSDPNTGAPRQTPLETQLAAMQLQDQQQSLQAALSSAQQQLAADQAASASPSVLLADQQAVAQAQRQIDENNLAIQATKERQQADADYAKAVQTYQDQRTAAEAQMNNQLDALSRALQRGTGNIGKLAKIASQFGVTLSGDKGVSTAMKALGTAIHNLVTVLNAESKALRGVGATKAAKTAKDQAHTVADGEGSTTTTSTSAGKKKHHHHHHTAPARSGGRVVTDSSTAGAAPDLSLPPQGSADIPDLQLPSLFSTSTLGLAGFRRLRLDGFERQSGDVILVVDSRELARANAEGLSRDRHAVHLHAKHIKPALAKVASVG